MNDVPISPAEFAMLRRRLQSLRARAGARAVERSQEWSLLLDAPVGHAAAPVELETELAVAARLAGGAREVIDCVEDALDRMDDGTYGQCRECGELIGVARLVAIPTAELCLACRATREQADRRSA